MSHIHTHTKRDTEVAAHSKTVSLTKAPKDLSCFTLPYSRCLSQDEKETCVKTKTKVCEILFPLASAQTFTKSVFEIT